jgi:hypothetical protein
MHCHGLQDKLIDGFQEVLGAICQNSTVTANLSSMVKGILDGSRPLGKVLKSKGYSEPNIKQFL